MSRWKWLPMMHIKKETVSSSENPFFSVGLLTIILLWIKDDNEKWFFYIHASTKSQYTFRLCMLKNNFLFIWFKIVIVLWYVLIDIFVFSLICMKGDWIRDLNLVSCDRDLKVVTKMTDLIQIIVHYITSLRIFCHNIVTIY